MNNKEKMELLMDIKKLLEISESDFQRVLLQYRQSRDNIIYLLADLFIRLGDNGKLDYLQLINRGEMIKFKRSIERELNKISTVESMILYSILFSTFEQGYYTIANKLQNHMKKKLLIKNLSSKTIKEAVDFNWSGLHFRARINKNQQALEDSLITTFVRGIQDGETIDVVGSKYRKHFNSKAEQSKRLQLTETMQVISYSNEKIYQENNLMTVEYTSALENNTCSECASLHGEIFSLDDPNRPLLPRHPKCLCIYLPSIGS